MIFVHLIFALAILISPISSEAGDGHDHLADIRCIDCHLHLPLRDTPPPPFLENIAAICRQCHSSNKYGGPDNGGTFLIHPIDSVVTWRIPADMPLDRQGRMTCITCHYFHHRQQTSLRPTKFMLRRAHGKTLCMNCHNKSIPEVTARPAGDR